MCNHTVPKYYQNLVNKVEPVVAGADATMLCVAIIYRILCKDSDYFGTILVQIAICVLDGSN